MTQNGNRFSLSDCGPQIENQIKSIRFFLGTYYLKSFVDCNKRYLIENDCSFYRRWSSISVPSALACQQLSLPSLPRLYSWYIDHSHHHHEHHHRNKVILIQKILFLQLLHGFKLFHLVSDFQNSFCF